MSRTPSPDPLTSTHPPPPPIRAPDDQLALHRLANAALLAASPAALTASSSRDSFVFLPKQQSTLLRTALQTAAPTPMQQNNGARSNRITQIAQSIKALAPQSTTTAQSIAARVTQSTANAQAVTAIFYRLARLELERGNALNVHPIKAAPSTSLSSPIPAPSSIAVIDRTPAPALSPTADNQSSVAPIDVAFLTNSMSSAPIPMLLTNPAVSVVSVASSTLTPNPPTPSIALPQPIFPHFSHPCLSLSLRAHHNPRHIPPPSVSRGKKPIVTPCWRLRIKRGSLKTPVLKFVLFWQTLSSSWPSTAARAIAKATSCWRGLDRKRPKKSDRRTSQHTLPTTQNSANDWWQCSDDSNLKTSFGKRYARCIIPALS